MGDDPHDCYQIFYLKKIDRAIRPSLLRRHHIKFNFCFELEILDWLRNLDSETQPEFMGRNGPSTSFCVSASIPVENPLTYQEIRQVVEGALTSLPDDSVPYEWRRQLIEYAWEEASEFVSKPLCGCSKLMDIDIQMCVQHNHVFYDPLAQEIGRCCMVPAADSSIQSLKKCEDVAETSCCCCCICLEDLSGCEALCLRLPCGHVFHGECIGEWLRTSHYCPLCRFEMPTA